MNEFISSRLYGNTAQLDVTRPAEEVVTSTCCLTTSFGHVDQMLFKIMLVLMHFKSKGRNTQSTGSLVSCKGQLLLIQLDNHVAQSVSQCSVCGLSGVTHGPRWRMCFDVPDSHHAVN